MLVWCLSSLLIHHIASCELAFGNPQHKSNAFFANRIWYIYIYVFIDMNELICIYTCTERIRYIHIYIYIITIFLYVYIYIYQHKSSQRLLCCYMKTPKVFSGISFRCQELPWPEVSDFLEMQREAPFTPKGVTGVSWVRCMFWEMVLKMALVIAVCCLSWILGCDSGFWMWGIWDGFSRWS